MSSRRTALTTLAGGALLAGCGFHLRAPPKLSFRSIHLAGFAPRSPMAEEFRRVLSAQVQVLDTPAKADVVLQALDEVRDRIVAALTAAAQVRDLSVRLKFNFRAYTPGGRELIPRAEMMLSRDMSYNESQALAKEYEAAELYREMQSDMVGQVMRRLATLTV